MKIILVQDSPGEDQIITNMLNEDKSFGYTINVCRDLVEANRLLKKFDCDIMIIDKSLFSTREIEILDGIKRSFPEIPFLAITDFDHPNQLIYGSRIEIRNCLYKHKLSTSILIDAIRNSIETHKLIFRLKKKEDELESSEIRFRTMIEKNLYGIVITDRQSRIKYINPAGKEILGMGDDASCVDHVFPNMKQDSGNTLSTDTVRIPIQRKNKIIHLEMNSAELRWKDEAACLITFRDITEKIVAQEKLNKTLEELERSNSDLEKFAYAVSHDLCEPLRSITGFIQLLEKNYRHKLDEKADHYICRTAAAAQRMQAMITSVLDYSRINTKGALFKHVDCNDVMKNVLSNLEKNISDSGAEITCDKLPILCADAVQLGRVFQNLIANAIKYRGKGIPKIHAGVKQNESEFVFSVSDNGIGIDSKYFERIFILFQRLQLRDDSSGYGVGLALCKRIIERHKGKIWLESESGKGSVFHFTIPAFLPHK